MPRLQRDLTVRGDLTVGRGGSVRRPATTHSFPFAGELQGALADGFAEGLVGGEGVEPFGLWLVVGSQEVKQTQGLTLFRVEARYKAAKHLAVNEFKRLPFRKLVGLLCERACRNQDSFDSTSIHHHTV